MNNNQKTPMDKMVEVLKQEYQRPAKILLWGKAVREWGSFIIGGGVFLFLFLMIVCSLFSETPEEKHKASANQRILPHMPAIAKFLEVNIVSIAERQKVLSTFLEFISLHGDSPATQRDLERKVDLLSKLLNQCNMSRGSFVQQLSETSDPFGSQQVYKDFIQLTDHGRGVFEKGLPATALQEENEQWRELCGLCETEVKKAQSQLAQMLSKGP